MRLPRGRIDQDDQIERVLYCKPGGDGKSPQGPRAPDGAAALRLHEQSGRRRAVAAGAGGHGGRSPAAGLALRREQAEVLKYRERFSVVLLRAAAIYGPRDEDFLEYFRWIKRGICPVLGGRKVLSLVYVRDAVRAALLAGSADLPSGEIYNIAGPKTCSWEDLGHIAAGLLGKKPVAVRLPLWSAYLASAASEGIGRLLGGGNSLFNISKIKQMKPDSWVADVRKAQRDLGFETRFSLEQGLGETIAWYLWKGLL
jgi:nucleoside-diphosphate-sugar epimerase